ncbi:asparagine synthase (glutamine-hydrolyzing) [Candidatus Uhrbacteria bacterium]|nr:asparagine synthase (glutamine-hydrolyzing) [Candidatus Uhrbacteria bacterium]
MCGLAGFAGSGGSTESLRKMAKALERRGPDDEGFFEAPGVGFAFRRLSIIDVGGGHQPLSNNDGTVQVMLNGEIFGFRKLRDELLAEGFRFKTNSDTEVIVRAYEKWGDDCFERLEGMFAIAIWDAKLKRLVIARDRLGKKPLYWTEKNGTIWFASELKALLSAGVVEKQIDHVALAAYFRSDAVPTPRSIFANVSKLAPASAMSWKDGKMEKTWKFWGCPQETIDVADPVAGLSERFDLAVKERLVSDVPLGLFLSGGLDSTAVAESASRQSSSKLKAFTIGFEDKSHDETEAASLVAKSLGLEHYVEKLTAESALLMIDEATELLDEPLADAAILPQLLLSRFAREQVTVALSGDGGDELLMGYQHIPAHEMTERFPGMMSVGSKLLGAIPASGGYFSAGFKAQRFVRGASMKDRMSRDLAWRGAMDASTLKEILHSNVLVDSDPDWSERLLIDYTKEAGVDADGWRGWSWAYLRSFLMDEVLVKVDRATMWYSLESRAPLLDRRVVEYLLTLPTKYKTGVWKKKRLLRELVKGRVPAEILNKPKHGFGVPVADWLRGPLKSRLMELTSAERLREQGLFQPEGVEQLVREHLGGKIDRRKELWAMLQFQLWYSKWFRV